MFQGWSLCRSCDYVYPECMPVGQPSAGSPTAGVPASSGTELPPRQTEVPACVHVACPSLAGVQRSCITAGPIIEVDGAQCRDCDVVDPFCEGLNLEICPNHIVDCTGVPKSTPKKCIEQSVIQFNNQPCLSCPFLNTTDPDCNTPDLRRCPGLQCTDISQLVPSTCIMPGRMVILGSSQCQMCPDIDPECPIMMKNCLELNTEECINSPVSLDIPKECIDQRVNVNNGDLCLTCKKLKQTPTCLKFYRPPNAVASPQGVPLCPDSFCPPLAGIPQNCIAQGELSIHEGATCRKCPVIDPFCPGLNLEICQNHILDCWGTPRNTPNRCKSQSVISFENKACLTCPYFKSEEAGCIEETYNLCPGVQCSSVRGVPYRCLSQPTQTAGSQCSTECPSRLMMPGCPMPPVPPRQPPPASAPRAPPAPRAPVNPGPFNPRLCPALMCPELPRNVPESCLRQGVIMGINGQECPGCYEIDPSCQLQQLEICENLLPTCPQVTQGLPARCYEQSTVSYNGRRCLTCPEVLQRCRRATVLT